MIPLTEFRQCLGRRFLLTALGAAAMALPSLNAQQQTSADQPTQAETTAPALEYDVVSVKEYKFEGGSFSSNTSWLPNGLSAMNIQLYVLINMAYGVDFYRISGGPDWAKRSYFQVQARMDDATVEALKKLPQEEAEAMRRRMLQAVLADRFKLTVRRETRLYPAYALVLAKGGSRLHEAAPEDPHADTTATATSHSSRGNMWGNSENGVDVLTGNAISLDALAGAVGGWVNAKVRNETGLKGVYDLKLRFALDNGPSGIPDASAPTIFVALQEQLGLKLESRKEPDEALIIEHAEKPSEN
jgi:uncharacterized protein (TIGR03435 family)